MDCVVVTKSARKYRQPKPFRLFAGPFTTETPSLRSLKSGFLGVLSVSVVKFFARRKELAFNHKKH
jgi:hypothetical protein